MSKDLKQRREGIKWLWRKTFPGRGQTVRSPEVGACPACLKESRTAIVAEVE